MDVGEIVLAYLSSAEAFRDSTTDAFLHRLLENISESALEDLVHRALQLQDSVQLQANLYIVLVPYTSDEHAAACTGGLAAVMTQLRDNLGATLPKYLFNFCDESVFDTISRAPPLRSVLVTENSLRAFIQLVSDGLLQSTVGQAFLAQSVPSLSQSLPKAATVSIESPSVPPTIESFLTDTVFSDCERIPLEIFRTLLASFIVAAQYLFSNTALCGSLYRLLKAAVSRIIGGQEFVQTAAAEYFESDCTAEGIVSNSESIYYRYTNIPRRHEIHVDLLRLCSHTGGSSSDTACPRLSPMSFQFLLAVLRSGTLRARKTAIEIIYRSSLAPQAYLHSFCSVYDALESSSLHLVIPSLQRYFLPLFRMEPSSEDTCKGLLYALLHRGLLSTAVQVRKFVLHLIPVIPYQPEFQQFAQETSMKPIDLAAGIFSAEFIACSLLPAATTLSMHFLAYADTALSDLGRSAVSETADIFNGLNFVFPEDLVSMHSKTSAEAPFVCPAYMLENGFVVEFDQSLFKVGMESSKVVSRLSCLYLTLANRQYSLDIRSGVVSSATVFQSVFASFLGSVVSDVSALRLLLQNYRSYTVASVQFIVLLTVERCLSECVGRRALSLRDVLVLSEDLHQLAVVFSQQHRLNRAQLCIKYVAVVLLLVRCALVAHSESGCNVALPPASANCAHGSLGTNLSKLFDTRTGKGVSLEDMSLSLLCLLLKPIIVCIDYYKDELAKYLEGLPLSSVPCLTVELAVLARLHGEVYKVPSKFHDSGFTQFLIRTIGTLKRDILGPLPQEAMSFIACLATAASEGSAFFTRALADSDEALNELIGILNASPTPNDGADVEQGRAILLLSGAFLDAYRGLMLAREPLQDALLRKFARSLFAYMQRLCGVSDAVLCEDMDLSFTLSQLTPTRTRLVDQPASALRGLMKDVDGTTLKLLALCMDRTLSAVRPSGATTVEPFLDQCDDALEAWESVNIRHAPDMLAIYSILLSKHAALLSDCISSSITQDTSNLFRRVTRYVAAGLRICADSESVRAQSTIFVLCSRVFLSSSALYIASAAGGDSPLLRCLKMMFLGFLHYCTQQPAAAYEVLSPVLHGISRLAEDTRKLPREECGCMTCETIVDTWGDVLLCTLTFVPNSMTMDMRDTNGIALLSGAPPAWETALFHAADVGASCFSDYRLRYLALTVLRDLASTNSGVCLCIIDRYVSWMATRANPSNGARKKGAHTSYFDNDYSQRHAGSSTDPLNAYLAEAGRMPLLVFQQNEFLIGSVMVRRQGAFLRALRMVCAILFHTHVRQDLARIITSLYKGLFTPGWVRSSREVWEQSVALLCLCTPNPLQTFHDICGGISPKDAYAIKPVHVQSIVLIYGMILDVLMQNAEHCFDEDEVSRVFTSILPCVYSTLHGLRAISHSVFLNCYSHKQLRDVLCRSLAFTDATLEMFDIALSSSPVTRKFKSVVSMLSPGSSAYTRPLCNVYTDGNDERYAVSGAVGNVVSTLLEKREVELDTQRAEERLGGCISYAMSKNAKQALLNMIDDGPIDAPADTDDFQQKIHAASDAATAQDCKRAVDESRSLVICASLLDRTSNLGGINRTAEIFGCSELVLPDLTLTQDPLYQSMSVTSDHWIKLTEVPPARLLRWITSMRRQGYQIVALEQSTRSVPLQRSALPKKCVMVLGNERRGCPDVVLSLCDMTCEIPQFGIIRSLNVHVSCSLFIWEWVRQHRTGVSE